MFSIALLLFCFTISNPLTRIFSAVAGVVVTALIGWCIRSAWESSDERGLWLARLIPYITGALDHVHGARDDIVTLILRRGNHPPLPHGHSGSSHALNDRERGAV